jgi:hypothetical protein
LKDCTAAGLRPGREGYIELMTVSAVRVVTLAFLKQLET